MAVGVGLLPVSRVQGQVTMQFPVSRDTNYDSWDGGDGFGDPPVFDKTVPTEEFSSWGQIPGIRGKKTGQHASAFDWDTDAMAAWVAANTSPGDTVAWTLNVFPLGNGVPTADVTVQTLESLNDWVEGDQRLPRNFENFFWSENTAASTQDFAQTYWKFDDEGDRVLDLERSLPWIDDDTGTEGINDNQYSVLDRPDDFSQGNPIPNFVNASVITPDSVDNAAANITSFQVNLDPAVVNALLTDENNRGLIFGPLSGGAGGNWQIFSREATGDLDAEGQAVFQSDSTQWPTEVATFIEVTVNPASEGFDGVITGDMDRDADVDFDDINPFVLGLNDPEQYLTDFGIPSSSTGDTDFDGDQDFDDIGGFVAILTGGSVASVVPEPASCLLIIMGLVGLLTTRWRGRDRD